MEISAVTQNLQEKLFNKVEEGNKTKPMLKIQLTHMTYPSITHSPLDNLYKSIELEKEMRRDLEKKGLNIKNINTSEYALENEKAFKLKVKKLKNYCAGVRLSLKNTNLNINSENSSTYEAKDSLILIEKYLEENNAGQPLQSNDLENKNNVTTISSVQGSQNGLSTETEDKEDVKSLPPFIHFYTNLSLNETETKEGILKKNTFINYNKYINNLTRFDAGIASNLTIGFNFINKIKISINNLYKLLVASLNPTKAIISQPYINEYANNIKINVFFYLYGKATRAMQSNKKNAYLMPVRGKNKFKFLNLENVKPGYLSNNAKRFKLLCENLSQIFKKRLTLVLIRLFNPTSNGQILSTAIGSSTKKNRYNKIKHKILKGLKIVNPNRIVDKTLFDYNSLYSTKDINPANLSGVSVRVAGRLVTEKVVPRKTVRSFQIGSLARNKANIVTTDRYTKKNKRGCFSVTVKTGHFMI